MIKFLLTCPCCGNTEWERTETEAGEPIFQCGNCGEQAQPEEMYAEAEDELDSVQDKNWNDAEMVNMTVYRDSSGLYSPEEYEDDNLCVVSIPKAIVQEYYTRTAGQFEEEQMEALGCERKDCCFEKWLTVYTADDTTCLCWFARQMGFKPSKDG